jgi:hypothetical protein
MRSLPRLLLVAALIPFVVAQAYPCSWAKGYFYQVTRLRGKVVGAKLGPLQYARWLRQSFARSGAKLTVYEYRWPIHSRSDMPLIKATQADSHGSFDFGRLQGEAPAYAGTDFIIARDGRIAAVYLFFDKLP